MVQNVIQIPDPVLFEYEEHSFHFVFYRHFGPVSKILFRFFSADPVVPGILKGYFGIVYRGSWDHCCNPFSKIPDGDIFL